MVMDICSTMVLQLGWIGWDGIGSLGGLSEVQSTFNTLEIIGNKLDRAAKAMTVCTGLGRKVELQRMSCTLSFFRWW